VTLAGSGLSEEAVCEARRLYREQATELVVALVEGALARRSDDPAAIRAAHLAGELRLTGAAPALGRCLERLGGDHQLRRAALAVLPRLEGPGADALLEGFDRCGDVHVRSELANALARAAEPADRIRAALLRLAEEVPETGADLLAARGDWRAVPALLAVFDRVSAAPSDHACALCKHLDLLALSEAISALGGELTEARAEVLAEASERAETEQGPWERPGGGKPGRAH
jgi:hypothetical protein